MPYVLRTLDQVVRGSLSPVFFPINTAEQLRCYEQLTEVPTTATRQIHVQFKKEIDRLTIYTAQIQLLDPHRLSVLDQDYRVPADDIQEETLLAQVLTHFSLSVGAVISWCHWQDEDKQTHLQLYARYLLEDLGTEERRYHFYQCLLLEQVAAVQQQMNRYVHQTPSTKKVRKYVQDHLDRLIHYAGCIHQQLGEDHSPAPSSNFHGLLDALQLVLLKVEELTGFVEKQFARYLEPSAPVSQRLRQNIAHDVLPVVSKVEQAIRRGGLDGTLATVLSEPLGKMKNLPNSPITRQQLDYLQSLLRALQRWQQQTEPDEQQLITHLFSLNFNSPAFTNWFTSYLQRQLATASDTVALLHDYRKFCRQLPVQPQAYAPEQPTIDHSVLRWVDEELAYRQQELDVVTADPGLPVKKRIKTTLTVAQMAGLLRLFRLANIFPRQNQQNVFRQFGGILYSLRQEEISPDSLRGLYHELDDRTIAFWKDKFIKMINLLNSLPSDTKRK